MDILESKLDQNNNILLHMIQMQLGHCVDNHFEYHSFVQTFVLYFLSSKNSVLRESECIFKPQ